MSVCLLVCVSVCLCVSASVRACVRACVDVTCLVDLLRALLQDGVECGQQPHLQHALLVVQLVDAQVLGARVHPGAVLDQLKHPERTPTNQ